MTNDGNFLGNDIYIGTNGISLLFFVVSVKNQTFDLEVSGIITTFAF